MPSTHSMDYDPKIDAWLEGISSIDPIYCLNFSPSAQSAQGPACRRKRKRTVRNTQVPSPPTSSHNPVMASSASSPKKRKKAAENVDDTQLTPRAPTSRRFDDDTSSEHSLSHSEALSQTSTRSPTKMSPFIQLDPAGFEIGPINLDDPEMPEAVKQFIEEIENIAAGQHVVPSILKEDIDKLKRNSRSYISFRDYVYVEMNEEEGVDRLSLVRLLEDVLKTVAVAQECQRVEQDENGWNHIVHTPLLDTILGRQSQNITGFVPCMAASILPEWRIQPQSGTRLGTRVDYAIVVNTEHDPQQGVQEAVQRLRCALPDASANHTGFAPLRHRPIGVSIETKRYGGHERKAEFQLGIWHSAQWKLFTERGGDGIAQLPFIPGIIVQGHEWKLVVTTNKGSKTKLWASFPFGSTQTPLGTFQVIAGVRRLARWSSEVFWPWYKTHLLQLPPNGESNSLVVLPDKSRPSG